MSEFEQRPVMNESDYSSQFFSNNKILKNIARIFPDSLILNEQRQIVSLGDNIGRLLGCKLLEVGGWDISALFVNSLAATEFLNHLAKGSCENLVAYLSFQRNRNVHINCRISGVQFSSLGDSPGIAIVKIEAMDELGIQANHLIENHDALDEFVYRTTHDLRGPVATIQGLLSLINLERPKLTDYLKTLVEHIEKSTQILSDRLFNLNYLSETANCKTVNYNLDSAELESRLRSTLEQNLAVNNIVFHIKSSNRFYGGLNANLTTGLLNHLLLYFISLPRNGAATITYSIEAVKPGILVKINSQGFLTTHQHRQAIINKDPLYTTIISYAELINFFAAMKSAERMRASISIDSMLETEQEITVVVPTCSDVLYLPENK
jgi:signal transduction histidine kinase